MSKVLFAIRDEDNSMNELAKKTGLQKSEVIILALNLLNYIFEQRKAGKHLIFNDKDKTFDILKEATSGELKFKPNEE